MANSKEFTVTSYVQEEGKNTKQRRKVKFPKLSTAREFAKQRVKDGSFITLTTKGGTVIPYTSKN